MSYLRTYSIVFVALAATTAWAQWPSSNLGNLDPSLVRQNFLREFAPSITAADRVLQPLPIDEWGVHVMPLPASLRHVDLRLRPTQGLLILGVHAGSPADRASLRPGMVIAELDGELAKHVNQLRVREPVLQMVIILENGQSKMVSLALSETPSANPLAPIDDEVMLPNQTQTRSLRPRTGVSNVQPVMRSFSSSEANGQMFVAAVVNDGVRDVEVELQGSRRQIVSQLRQYSPAVEQAVRRQLGL